MPPREGSRKSTVYKSWVKDGVDVAMAVAVSAGLKLGTVKSWINGWSKADGKPSADGTEKPAQVRALPKGNIKVKWTKRPARLMAKGEQVSEIKWLDTGTIQAIANDQINFMSET